MKHQTILFSNDIDTALNSILSKMDFNKVVVIADMNTKHFVYPFVEKNKYIANAPVITVKAGDMNKNVESLTSVWKQLCDMGATRKTVVINLGGGVVTDLGGFAASTFKRGVRFVNIPTTLLCAVDAAVGGKTGINFNGLKNEVGMFNEAAAVIVSTLFFKTLPVEEIKSGYAEMLKHGLLNSKEAYSRLLKYDFTEGDDKHLLELLEESVKVKEDIVKQDPHEKGIRRALNLGHTAGHAFESLAMKRMEPIPHGYAVAWGVIVELTLAHMIFKFPSKILQALATFVYENYGVFNISCDDYNAIIALMRHDKKSESGEMNFTLLADIGDVKINTVVSVDDVKAALDMYRDFMHI